MNEQRSLLPRIALVMVWSTVVWIALWSDLSVANVIWGLVAGAVLCLVVPPYRGPRRAVVSPVGLLRFTGYSLWALVRASAVVAWEVVTPQNQINQGIVAAPLRTTSPAVITLIANVISLTPGTLTLEVREEPPTLYVHILHLRTIEEVRAEIHHLEDLALRAFPGVAESAASTAAATDPTEEPS